MATDAVQARDDLGTSIALALVDAEEHMRAAEAHHKAIGGDVLNPNGTEQRASLGECLLSHRVVAMLRQLAEMVPVPAPACLDPFHEERAGGMQVKDAR